MRAQKKIRYVQEKSSKKESQKGNLVETIWGNDCPYIIHLAEFLLCMVDGITFALSSSAS